MSYIAQTDYAYEVVRGNVPGESSIRRFGRNAAVSTSVEDVWLNGGVYTWATAAAQLDVVSGSANDDDSTGSGAHKLIIEGLDASFDAITETVALDGTTTVTTTASFRRVTRAYVDMCGTYGGTNEGQITVSVTGGGATQLIIPVGKGESQIARYTVPDGSNGYLNNADIFTTAAATVRLCMRDKGGNTSSPVRAKRTLIELPSVNGHVPLQLGTPFGPFASRADLWWEAVTAAGTAEVAVAFEVVLEPDGS